MAAWTGKPVLAKLDASYVPAIPASEEALRGHLAAVAAVCDVASHPDDVARRWAFDAAVLDARTDRHSYAYSRAFLDSVVATADEIADLLDADTAENLAAIRAAHHLVILTPGRS